MLLLFSPLLVNGLAPAAGCSHRQKLRRCRRSVAGVEPGQHFCLDNLLYHDIIQSSGVFGLPWEVGGGGCRRT